MDDGQRNLFLQTEPGRPTQGPRRTEGDSDRTRRDLLWALGGLVYHEEGLADLIVRPGVYEQYRDVLRNAPLLWIEGRLQR